MIVFSFCQHITFYIKKHSCQQISWVQGTLWQLLLLLWLLYFLSSPLINYKEEKGNLWFPEDVFNIQAAVGWVSYSQARIVRTGGPSSSTKKPPAASSSWIVWYFEKRKKEEKNMAG